MKTNNLIVAGLLIAVSSATIVSGTFNSNKINQPKTDDFVTVKQEVHENFIANETQKTNQDFSETQVASNTNQNPEQPIGCVFKTAFEGEGIDQTLYYQIPAKVTSSIAQGLDWMVEAQQKDGGWGAGSHGNQRNLNPHTVSSDPATTAMVAMAIQRSGGSLKQGPYAAPLEDALNFLLNAVESSGENDLNITSLTSTQPQSKLGKNIDVVLTSQFLSNLVHDLDEQPALERRVKNAIQKCVDKIEMGQSSNGSQQGSGWAGVLQSSFASSALESAQSAGAEVADSILDRSRDYQKNNINTTTGDVVTESAAGIVLYSVSGSTRASAKETAKAKDLIKQAKREGKITNEEVTVDNLKKAGVSESKAMKYSTAYQVNKSAMKLAQDDNVMTGFGNNGGEEFLSYLQTGEGMIMSKDDEWKNWYDKMSNRLLDIQNNDGSWSGHHCITSPVFCTATCLLILSVNNDIDKLTMK